MEFSNKAVTASIKGADVPNEADWALETASKIQDQAELVLMDIESGNQVSSIHGRFMAIHQYAEMALAKLESRATEGTR